MSKFLWNITYCEKYESNWEEKTKYTKVWALFQNEKGNYSVKMFWQFLPVFIPKPKDNKQNDWISIDQVPF